MESNTTLTLPVKGMHCASCANIIKRNLSKIDGVEKAESYYGTEEAVITYDDKKTSIDAMNQTLKPFGYQLDNSSVNQQKKHDSNNHEMHNHAAVPENEEVVQEQKQAEFALPISIFIFVGMMWEILSQRFASVPTLPFPEPFWMMLQFILASVMLFIVGKVFLKAVWLFIRYRKANMDTLVGIGTVAAYAYSFIGFFFPTIFTRFQLPATLYFDVTIVVIGFIKYGKYLEARSKRQTGEALRSLMELQAKTALVEKDGVFVEVPVNEVQVGDVIKVKPGTSIPVDGQVTEGASSVDESMITGESLPINKSVGEQVIGGTLNSHGVLIITAQKVGSETVLARIVQMVKNAQNSKAPIERIADTVSGIFVPVVLVIAVLTLLTWIVVGGMYMPFSQAVAFGISCMIAVLVIACPCALGLATPTAIIVGIGQAAKKGILIKNAESLEQLQSVTTVVFDKTGTLTTGKPTLQRVVSFSQLSEQKLLTIAAALESHSEHPLSRAVVEYAEKQKLSMLPKVNNFSNIAGEGVTGEIDKTTYWIGSEKLAVAKHKKSNTNFIAEPGESLLYLFNKSEVLGVLTVADQLKDTTPKAIELLKEMNIKLVMLSGDRQITAQHFADQLHIDRAIGEVKPDQKLAFIKELQAAGEIVAMVGDGINDAPALAAANVGIAMSTGTDVAMSTAQATILKGDLRKVATVISLSKSVMTVIKQNLFWAFAYNVLGIPLAAGILYPYSGLLLSPAFAGMAMGFSSVSVILNSLRLRFNQSK